MSVWGGGFTRAREEVATRLVEGEGHHAIGQVESLLDAVAMVDVDVDVQHSRMHLLGQSGEREGERVGGREGSREGGREGAGEEEKRKSRGGGS